MTALPGSLSLLLVALLAASSPARAAEAPPVLFDEAHGQRFLVGSEEPLGLSRLGETFRAAGATVRASAAPFSPSSLAGARVVVLSGAFAPPSAEEESAILEFVRGGGSLAVMLHVGPPLARLIERFGVVVANGVIRESDGVLAGDPINFHVRHLSAHPVTRGLDGFAVYGGWALLPTGDGMTALGETGPHAWVDLNRSGRYDEGDAMQTFVVAAAGSFGEGRVAVFADDAMFQNRFLEGSAENRRLAAQLAAWLLGRSAEGTLAEAAPHRNGLRIDRAR